MMPVIETIPALLRKRSDEMPDDVAYTFVDYDADPNGRVELSLIHI